jgi:hypothetical protein
MPIFFTQNRYFKIFFFGIISKEVFSEKGNNADWLYVDMQKGKNDDKGGITSTLFFEKSGVY